MLRTRRRGHRRDERGAAVVEFAIVMPLLFMVLFGMITTGLAFSDHLSATNAVREASRYGAAADVSQSDWATSVRDRVKETYFNAGDELPTDAQICVRLVQASGTIYAQHAGASCGNPPTMPTSMDAGSCAVVVWMEKPRKVRLLVVPDLEVDIWAASVSYYQREVQPTCGTP